VISLDLLTNLVTLRLAGRSPANQIKGDFSMITVTVSFKPSESSAEVIAQMVKLLAELENSVTTEPKSDPVVSPVEAEVKATKPRKVRVYTDEQKAAFRARMVAAREAKETAKAKPVEPVKIAGSKKLIKPPMPRTGHKVKASPAAQ
jgi:hypothetical protein